MCGIAGIVTPLAGEPWMPRLKCMTDALQHRGPEGEGFWKNDQEQVYLGHRRLSIIDLSRAGAQPMHYQGKYTIVYNGEIYNYKEIRRDLAGQGFIFHSQTDTEVILAAYACYKEACLHHFDGMFSFAIWDHQEQTLFAARDRFGEKPFYYHQRGNTLFFASEIKALWKAGIEKRVNEPMVFNFLTLGYTGNPENGAETFFHGVEKLPAGSCMHYHAPTGRLTVERYWQLETNTVVPATEKEAVEQFSTLLHRSVQRRLRSDVPVGTSLSGGLDSSSIITLIKEISSTTGQDAFKTFSAVFPGYEKDESSYIHTVQQHLSVSNYQVLPSAEGLLQDFEKLCHCQDEPFISSSIYAQYKVYGLAKEMNVTVLLDGQGADETLAGYSKYYHWYWQELLVDDAAAATKEMRLAGEAGIREPWDWRNKLAARYPQLAARAVTSQRRKKQRSTPDLHKDFVDRYGQSYYSVPDAGGLKHVLKYNTCRQGLEELLRYADRNSMAHGREIRLPFLSHELVEYIFSLPADFKIRDAWTKWILRKSMEARLPDTIVWRRDKVGFEPPQKQWVENKMMQEYLRQEKTKLVKAGVLHSNALLKTTKPQDALAAFDTEWRYLVAGKLF